MRRSFFTIGLFLYCLGMHAQYIAEVIEYVPAPGQFINTAWGSPRSAASLIGGINGALNLGAFGGYVVFAFENPVENHPGNPYGVDFTIFGNAHQAWSEPGIVSVMKDENGNGLPDDTWYELAGSDHFFSTTTRNYEVTYTNPGLEDAADVPWSDNMGGTGVINANSYHTQPYFPLADSFPGIHTESYSLQGTRLTDPVDRSNPSNIRSNSKAFGYADNRPRGSAPYTLPDNPYTSAIENSGGDAFDIDWAVDENGSYVDLDRVHFIKVHNAVMAGAGWLGQVSTEITGAVDVAPAPGMTGPTELLVIRDLPDTLTGNRYPLEAFAFRKGRHQPGEKISWSSNLADVWVDENGQLVFHRSGELVLTASLESKPEIKSTIRAMLRYANPLNSFERDHPPEYKLYPNPASKYFRIEGAGDARISLYDLAGCKVLEIKHYSGDPPIAIGHLPKGLYIVNLREDDAETKFRILKR